MSDPIYLDHNASTPLDHRVKDTMIDALEHGYGNPSSSHQHGNRQRDLIETSRRHVGSAIGTGSSAVTFTSGATEANNLALTGLAHGALNDRRRILISATEHASVKATAAALNQHGTVKVETINANLDGRIDLNHLEQLLADDVLLVSAMAVNSETGAINPINEIAALTHNAGAFFHCDATQAIGRIPIDMNQNAIDMLTLSSHKIYGPHGIGAFAATATVSKHLVPVIHGGGQENGLRSGTENVAGIIGFGKAAQLATEQRDSDNQQIGPLRDHLETTLITQGRGVVNSTVEHRTANTTNIWFPDAPSDAVLINMPSIAASTGSACSSGAPEPSPVLLAMGHDRVRANESIRFSLGRFTTKEHIDKAIPQILAAVDRTRTLHTT